MRYGGEWLKDPNLWEHATERQRTFIEATIRLGSMQKVAEELKVRTSVISEALKCALGANIAHGHRRTNDDKRRCVEIALVEFANMSSRAIAEMCGVSGDFVNRQRQLSSNDNSTTTRTGKDGKQYTGKKAKAKPKPAQPAFKPKLGPPADGMQFARMAVLQLEQIRPDDIERTKAFSHVKGWIIDHETKT